MLLRHTLRSVLFVTTALGYRWRPCPDHRPQRCGGSVESVIVTSDRESTHSAVEINTVQAQKIVPGISAAEGDPDPAGRGLQHRRSVGQQRTE